MFIKGYPSCRNWAVWTGFLHMSSDVSANLYLFKITFMAFMSDWVVQHGVWQVERQRGRDWHATKVEAQIQTCNVHNVVWSNNYRMFFVVNLWSLLQIHIYFTHIAICVLSPPNILWHFVWTRQYFFFFTKAKISYVMSRQDLEKLIYFLYPYWTPQDDH